MDIALILMSTGCVMMTYEALQLVTRVARMTPAAPMTAMQALHRKRFDHQMSI
jgi:hypothetical protein